MTARKILVVDDSATERHILVDALSGAGYRCIVAANGNDGVEKARAEQPDAILMDVVMPGMNGFQATRTITRDDVTRHIPIIMVSSKSQETDKVWGIRQGAAAYLTKPVNVQELLAKVAALFSD